jgi:hypothetical protein
MARILTTLRAPKKWLEEVQQLADRLSVSRTTAILICTNLGMKVLNRVEMTQDQFDRLLKNKADES